MKTNLAEKLGARRQAFAAKAQPDWVVTMEASIGELVEANAADRAPQVGAAVPLFTLPDVDGHQVGLGDVLADGPVILSFYRGRW